MSAKERPFADGSANGSSRPFAGITDRLYERAESTKSALWLKTSVVPEPPFAHRPLRARLSPAARQDAAAKRLSS